jgi:hypothetical protein
MASCAEARNAVEGDGGSLWRRRFARAFDTQPRVDLVKIKSMYQERKAVLHVIHPAFQWMGHVPNLSFDLGMGQQEVVALKLLKDLIIGEWPPLKIPFWRHISNTNTEAFTNKPDNQDSEYESVNLAHIIDFAQKSNLLRIVGKSDRSQEYFLANEIPHPATSLLYTIQCVLAPLLLSFDNAHRYHQFGFYEAQMMVYLDDVTAPILLGHTGQSVNMSWLLKNIQFWRHHFLTMGEPLAPFFEGLEKSELPALWSHKLSQGRRELGCHWKGSYAFVDRDEIKLVRDGRSGQGNSPMIQDKMNGEEDPDCPFQSIQLNLAPDDNVHTWNRDFEGMLDSLKTPEKKSRTRAQKSATGGADTQETDFATSSYHFTGHGNDDAEDFEMEGWLNPLPPQNGIPGWQRVTMMKFFREQDDTIDMGALWAYEGIMIPGGKIMIGRWWCPTDGTGPDMYSGPFILWNVPCGPPKRPEPDVSCEPQV